MVQVICSIQSLLKSSTSKKIRVEQYTLRNINDKTLSNLNNYRWRFEMAIGESKGIVPFSDSFFSTNNQKKFKFYHTSLF
jgi:hypothetical protein